MGLNRQESHSDRTGYVWGYFETENAEWMCGLANVGYRGRQYGVILPTNLGVIYTVPSLLELDGYDIDSLGNGLDERTV